MSILVISDKKYWEKEDKKMKEVERKLIIFGLLWIISNYSKKESIDNNVCNHQDN